MRFLIVTLFLALAGIGVGYGIFTIGLGGEPKLAVLDGPMDAIDDELTTAIKAKLRFVVEDPDIEAVVVRINSPGGSASASEELYAELAEVRKAKPVVVTVQGVAASGAYLMALGANEIHAGGTTIVGSIGAILTPPGREIPSEGILSTGPFKLTGGSERTYTELLEEVKEAFYATVRVEREERLIAPREEVLQGKVYLGLQALQLGLIDAIGDESDAINAAADLAGIDRYDILNVEEAMAKEGGALAEAVAVADRHRPAGDFDFDTSQSKFPYIHYLFLPPQ